MIYVTSRILPATATAMIALSASAHHNTGAALDLEQEVAIDGTVTGYEWKNRHLYFFVEAVGEDGAARIWRVEAGPLACILHE